MREIKFRVWDNQNDYWAKESEVIVSMGLEFGINDYFEKKNGADKCLRWCFQQYTGLKDTNGVEIYEGDIVQQDGELLIVSYGEYFTRGYRDVEDRHFGFYLKYSWEDAVNNILTFGDYFIVKGNVHQNKELLED